MPYTKQDCLNKIQDISTNLQRCFTEVAAKGMAVPADSSLDDLATLITAIPDASHPDYDLPWIMNDGSSGIWCPESAGRSATVWIDCELTPTDNTHVRLFGCQGTSLSNWGMDYNDTHVRSLRTLTKNIGTSTQTSDTANTVSVDWSGYPFYKRQELEASWTSSYRASILYNGSWTHAATTAAQQNTSNTPNMPFSLFCSIRYTNDSLTFPANSCKAGTKVYSVKRGTGGYTSTNLTTYSPVLRWDPVKKEYRATLVNKDNGRQWSFAKDDKYTEDGNMYYIDVTKGYKEVGVNASHMSYSMAKEYRTGIPHESGNVYVLQHYARTTTEQNYTCPIISNYNYGSGEEFFYRVRRAYITITDPNNPYNSEILQYAGGSYAYIETSRSDSSANKTYNYITAIPADSSNSSEAFATATSLTAVKSGRIFKYGTPSGYIRIYYKNNAEYVKFLAVYNNGKLRHYLVPIRVNGVGDVKYYDIVTKTLINPQ